MATTDDTNYIAKHHTPNVKIQCEICGEWEIVNGFKVVNEEMVDLRYICRLVPAPKLVYYRLEKGNAAPLPARIRKCDCEE